jgi:hypothetical protein
MTFALERRFSTVADTVLVLSCNVKSKVFSRHSSFFIKNDTIAMSRLTNGSSTEGSPNEQY